MKLKVTYTDGSERIFQTVEEWVRDDKQCLKKVKSYREEQ